MHVLLGVASLLLVILAGMLALSALRCVRRWGPRREVQLLVLAAPLLSLSLAIGTVHHFAGQVCFIAAPPWDYTLGAALPLAMGLISLGGLGFGLVRLGMLRRLVVRGGIPAGPELQALASRLAARLEAPEPRLLIRASERPLALTCGLIRPTVILSTWMLQHLDREELESVLAHELGHVTRRDVLVIWLGTVLRDSFFYVPTSWAAYRQLQRDKELACDDLALRATNQPLALASALAKVWQQAAGGAQPQGAQPLVDAATAIEERIERLLVTHPPAANAPWSRNGALGIGASALLGLLGLQAANLAVMLAPMGCGPASLFGRLLG